MPSPPSSPPWPSIFHPPSSSSTTASTTAQSSSSTFIPVSPHNLSPWIDDKSALIVDIRPHAPHSAARIPTSLGLSVPSTLLKRPNFPLERLAEMLSSQSARSRFLAWPKASRILVYDTDTNAIAESSNIMGLLRKFQNSGFSGQLAWLRGGYQAVWRERKDLIDSTPLTPEADMDDGDDHSSSTILRPKHLPAAAFSLCSTTAASPLNLHHRRLAGGARPSGVPDSTIPSTNVPTPAMPMAMAMSISLPLPPSVLTSSRQKSAFNPFFDAIRQNLELSHGITERIPLRLPARVRRRVHELPFSWLQRIARRAAPLTNGALEEHAAPGEGVPDISHDAKGRDALVEEGMEALALQFYRIELAEQRRLMGVMEYHSKESGRIIQSGEDCTQGDWFPFSIAAGVEKGIKNRQV
ncbi:hypothetical protein AX16_000552 [Volvariella volvacea WC 439]|nr:hypothetical protein AX16_000552 [Volvariella volvacea WC 439]